MPIAMIVVTPITTTVPVVMTVVPVVVPVVIDTIPAMPVAIVPVRMRVTIVIIAMVVVVAAGSDDDQQTQRATQHSQFHDKTPLTSP